MGPATGIFAPLTQAPVRSYGSNGTSSGVIGVPSTYQVDGIQYVAVQSGWAWMPRPMGRRIDGDRGTSTSVPEGGVIWVFALER